MSDVAARVRSQRRVWAAPGSHHDKMVRAALYLLPAGIIVLTGFLLFAPAFFGGDVSFLLDPRSVDVAKERLRIQTAVYRGEDQKGQTFTLTAGSAVQKSSAEPIVQLRDLTAAIQLQDGPAQVRADRGRYNMDTQRVELDGPVKVVAADGYTMNTENAALDLRTRRMASGGAVTGTMPLGTFAGNQMRADLETHEVWLDGNAHLRINPHRANRQP